MFDGAGEYVGKDVLGTGNQQSVFFFKFFYQWMDRKRGVGKKEGKEEQSVKWTDCNDVFISMKKWGLNKKYKIEVK